MACTDGRVQAVRVPAIATSLLALHLVRSNTESNFHPQRRLWQLT